MASSASTSSMRDRPGLPDGRSSYRRTVPSRMASEAISSALTESPPARLQPNLTASHSVVASPDSSGGGLLMPCPPCYLARHAERRRALPGDDGHGPSLDG